MTLRRDVIGNLIVSVLMMITPVATSLLAPFLYEPDEIGLYGKFLLFVQSLGAVQTLSINTISRVNFYKQGDAAGLGVGVSVSVMASPLSIVVGYLGEVPLPFVVGSIAFSVLASVVSDARLKAVTKQAVLESLQISFLPLCALLLAFKDGELRVGLHALFLSVLAIAGYLWLGVPAVNPAIALAYMKKIFRRSALLTSTYGVNFLASRLDHLFVVANFSDTVYGTYYTAYAVCNIFLVVFRRALLVLEKRFFGGRGNLELVLMVVSGWVATIVGGYVAAWVIVNYFPSSYASVGEYLPLMSIGVCFMMIGEVVRLHLLRDMSEGLMLAASSLALAIMIFFAESIELTNIGWLLIIVSGVNLATLMLMFLLRGKFRGRGER